MGKHASVCWFACRVERSEEEFSEWEKILSFGEKLSAGGGSPKQSCLRRSTGAPMSTFEGSLCIDALRCGIPGSAVGNRGWGRWWVVLL